MLSDRAKRPITIRVCMGSSCYTRGNRLNVETLREYLREHRLEDEVSLVGDLCQGACRKGPNIEIDGVAAHAMDPSSLPDLVARALRDRTKGE